MRDYLIYHVDSFTDQPFSGNPAGVVPFAEGLTEEDMRKIASEMNLSETAFLVPSQLDEADYRICYYTPTCEIDFCGHATLAAAWVLAKEFDFLKQSTLLTFETNIGLVPMEFSDVEGQLSITMTQLEPTSKEIPLNLAGLAEILGIDEKDIDIRYPVKAAHTGNWHLIVPMRTMEAIDLAVPNFLRLKEYNEEHSIITTHLFTLNTPKDEFFAYTRDFAPAVGVNEDPVTGSANGALAGYFLLEDIVETNRSFTIVQGNSMNRPGVTKIKTFLQDNKKRVKLGGQAVITIKGQVTLP